MTSDPGALSSQAAALGGRRNRPRRHW